MRRLPLLLLAFVATAPLHAQSTVNPGDVPAYSWRTSPFQSNGASSLEDFRGKPVLVDFWGTR